jgi:hypothetical protein
MLLTPSEYVKKKTLTLTSNSQKFIYDFATPFAWDAAKTAVGNLADAHGIQWTQYPVLGDPPVAVAFVVLPKVPYYPHFII